MISIESAFNELGIDAVTGVELMDLLGINNIDLGNPSRFSQFHTVIDYFKKFPPDTQRFMIRKVVTGKHVDKLQYVWEYTDLLRQKERAKGVVEKIQSEESILGDADPTILEDLRGRKIEAVSQLNSLNKELDIYQ